MSRQEAPPGCVKAFCAALFLVAILFMIAGFIVPAWRIHQASSWDEHQAEILEHAPIQGYDPVLAYTYEVDGERFKTDRYQLTNVEKTPERRRALVQRYPVGETFPCFVNPEDPSEAVLYRGWQDEVIFLVLSLIVMFVAGMGFFLFKHAAPEQDPDELVDEEGTTHTLATTHSATTEQMRDGAEGPIELIPGTKKTARTIILFFASSGMVVFAAVAFTLLTKEGPDHIFFSVMKWFIVALAVLLTTAFIHAAAHSTAPRVEVRLDEAHLEPGSEVDLEWRLLGRTPIEVLTWSLEERELHRAGVDSLARSKTTRTFEIAREESEGRILRGSTTLRIPEDISESEEDPERARRWVLVVHGSIPFRVDLREEWVLWIHRRSDTLGA